LAEGEYFERRVGAAAQEDAGGGKECEYERHLSRLTRRGAAEFVELFISGTTEFCLRRYR
jgi:hypothetical protein